MSLLCRPYSCGKGANAYMCVVLSVAQTGAVYVKHTLRLGVSTLMCESSYRWQRGEIRWRSGSLSRSMQVSTWDACDLRLQRTTICSLEQQGSLAILNYATYQSFN